MSEIAIRIEGHAGRITLQRPKALNALTYDMIRAIDAALDEWQDNDTVQMILIDAEGDKAFCAGGDIADLYRTGMAGDFAYGQTFWADEYRLNAKIAAYPKPTVSFMQGFTMGGGVGIGCHCAHRVVNGNSVVAMPECGIGLVPDVGGSLILARAPGHLGVYLGTTTRRVAGMDILYTGFGDHLVPLAEWEDTKARLLQSCDPATLPICPDDEILETAGLTQIRPWVDRHFDAPDLDAILTNLRQPLNEDADLASDSLKALARNSPLAMACTVKMIQNLQAPGTNLRTALQQEYRFTSRAMEHGDFLEGIRAAIIDKDRTPKWKHELDSVPIKDIETMIASLKAEELRWET